MSEIKNLNPTCIWKNFYALTQVPRPSGHLEKVQQFLLDFAKQAGVEAFKDPADNIVMRKPASAGMEKKKGVRKTGVTLSFSPQKKTGTRFCPIIPAFILRKSLYASSGSSGSTSTITFIVDSRLLSMNSYALGQSLNAK